MTNPDHLYNELRLVKLVDHTVVAKTNAIGSLAALKSADCSWEWIARQGINGRYNSLDDLTIDALEFA